MRLRMLLFALALGAMAAGSVWAEVQPIPLAAERSQIQVTSQSRDELLLRIEVGELTALDVDTKEGVFTRLLIPGFHMSQVEGAPELPMMNRLIAIPQGANARIEAQVVKSRLIDLADYGITHPLMPAQPSMPKSADPETWPFVYDRSAYQVGKVAQELARIEPVGRLRAMQLGRVEISPVEYLPQTNQIRVTEAIDVSIVFEGADHAAQADLMAQTYSPFFTPLYDKITNGKAFQDAYPDRVGDVVTMVVVTPPEFQAQMQPFVDWKTERGFHVIVGVTGTPEVGVTTTSIQTYLHNLYNSPPAGLPAPSFILFVGDVAQMPTFTLAGDASDRPYCAVDGDLVPDMYYGRFSATNSTMLQAILDKSMMYEQYTMPDPSYLGEVCMIAGVDSYWAPTHANGQINYGTDNYFNAAHGILSHTYLYPASGSSAAQIVQDVSNGLALVNYTAHGSTTSWSNPSFTQSDVNGLANSGEYCLAIGNCCLTSSYDLGECFGETFLRAADKGAIGYIGGSNSTYWDEDFWWGVGYTASITANPTYAATGLGAYDGLFHDHGEAEHLWYVTNDAIIFCGNLAVMEAGSARIEYYWNIYNLLGDPSLSSYLGVPDANPVVHPGTVFTTQPTITIDAEQGSYVGLTQNGVLVGAGTTDAGGSLGITFLQTPLIPGVPLHLVVTAQNREPYVADLNVIVPATVTIVPDVIDANVETAITVTVMEADGITPIPGIDIWAEGLAYATTPVATDMSGEAVITVNYPYGPTLDIVGKDPAEPYRLFTEPITVNASAMLNPDLFVTTDIGLDDAFALNLPGTLHAVVKELKHTLWAIMPDGTELSTAGLTLDLTPAELGEVTGIIAISGYDLYTETFDVIEAYGTLTGTVASGGSPLGGVTVQGYDAGMSLAFEAVTDGTGAFDVGEDILVADYTLVVDHFGYLHYETPYFVNYGANTYDIGLTPAPSGILTGTVTSAARDPLAATVRVYRSDTGELYTETVSDPGDGSYATAPLPYFDYRVTVKAFHYIPVTIDLTIEDPVIEKHFILEPTIGDLLVIDDSVKYGWLPDKIGEDGNLLAGGYESPYGKAAADLITDLDDLGYTSTLEAMAVTDPATWQNYDLLIVSSGANTTSLDNATFRNALISYVNAGGHLLLEGGEVGYDHASSGTFASVVLHTNDWNADDAGNVTVADPAHYVMSVPNTITGPITLAYTGYGDSDAMAPLADAVRVGSWSDYASDASIIAFDPNPAPEGGQIVFYCFNYSALDAAVRPDLLQNTVTWLMTPEIGTSSVSGTVTLQGETDHSGIQVEAIPGGGSVVTGPTGAYTLSGLYGGTYTIKATKTGWRSASTKVTLSDGQHLTGVDLELLPGTGTLLVIDDSGKNRIQPGKLDKLGHIIEPAFETEPGKTAVELVSDLESLGYSCEVQTVAETDPASWTAYDVLIVSCGANTSPVMDATFRAGLESYVQGCDNKLLIEGGELGYDAASYPGYPTFAGAVLHITSWNHDSSGNVTVADPSHFVMSVPNEITGPITMNYVSYGQEDAVTPAPGAEIARPGSWSMYPANASIVTYDPTPAPEAGQIVYYSFDYSIMDATARVELLENSIHWLLGTEALPTASISGNVYVDGAPDNSGVVVTANPGGHAFTTGPDGNYTLANLYAGTYVVTVALPGYGAPPQVVTLEAGQQVTGINFAMGQVTEYVFCDAPALAIPDNTPAGVSTTMLVTEAGLISDIHCSVDITHTYIGDLIVELTSPAGTVVRLHNGTGGTMEDIITTYDLLTPVDGPGAMSDFDGENPVGLWTLFVSDNASADIGTLNEWCLDLFIAEEVIGTSAGAMAAAVVQGGVTLSWDYDPGVYDGFHVYRRTAAGASERLTAEPLASGTGRIEFTDPGYGIAPGTQLYYSYAMVRGGEEIGRGSEIQVTFEGAVPTVFALYDNFPNPFNPMTNIRFDLPQSSRVNLQIFDIGGRLVRTLVDDQLPAASHVFPWDGTDDTGRRVASGTYTFRIITSRQAAAGKMMLVK
jgi:subtilisin-like proprotein convertase family protein